MDAFGDIEWKEKVKAKAAVLHEFAFMWLDHQMRELKQSPEDVCEQLTFMRQAVRDRRTVGDATDIDLLWAVAFGEACNNWLPDDCRV